VRNFFNTGMSGQRSVMFAVAIFVIRVAETTGTAGRFLGSSSRDHALSIGPVPLATEFARVFLTSHAAKEEAAASKEEAVDEIVEESAAETTEESAAETAEERGAAETAEDSGAQTAEEGTAETVEDTAADNAEDGATDTAEQRAEDKAENEAADRDEQAARAEETAQDKAEDAAEEKAEAEDRAEENAQQEPSGFTDDKDFMTGCLDFSRAVVVQSEGSKKAVADRMHLVCSGFHLPLDVEVCQKYRSTLLAHLAKDIEFNLKKFDYPLFCQGMEKVAKEHEAEVEAMKAK